MKLKIQELTTDSVEIIPQDNIVHQSVGDFQEACRQLVDDGKINLQLNLRQVAYIDTAGLGVLIGLRTHCRARHGSFTVTNINDTIRNILTVMRMDAVLGIDLQSPTS